eukprot:gene2060-1566_t
MSNIEKIFSKPNLNQKAIKKSNGIIIYTFQPDNYSLKEFLVKVRLDNNMKLSFVNEHFEKVFISKLEIEENPKELSEKKWNFKVEFEEHSIPLENSPASISIRSFQTYQSPQVKYVNGEYRVRGSDSKDDGFSIKMDLCLSSKKIEIFNTRIGFKSELISFKDYYQLFKIKIPTIIQKMENKNVFGTIEIPAFFQMVNSTFHFSNTKTHVFDMDLNLMNFSKYGISSIVKCELQDYKSELNIFEFESELLIQQGSFIEIPSSVYEGTSFFERPKELDFIPNYLKHKPVIFYFNGAIEKLKLNKENISEIVFNSKNAEFSFFPSKKQLTIRLCTQHTFRFRFIYNLENMMICIIQSKFYFDFGDLFDKVIVGDLSNIETRFSSNKQRLMLEDGFLEVYGYNYSDNDVLVRIPIHNEDPEAYVNWEFNSIFDVNIQKSLNIPQDTLSTMKFRFE